MKSNHQKLLVSILLFCLFSCSSTPSQSDRADQADRANQDRATHEPRSGLETVAILGTNDLHGNITPLSLKSREKPGIPLINYEAAGLSTLSAYIKKLREEFGNHLIWLDAGDEFQGTIESNLAQGAPMVQFFNYAKLNAAAIGNHEFDFGVNSLESRMSEAHYPYLAANISYKETGRPASFPNTFAHALFTAGNLRIGVIGLSTLDTPRTTRAINVKDFNFDELKPAVLREADALREMGAHIVVITSHVGLFCQPGSSPAGHIMRKPSDPQGECGDQDEMVRLLRSLPRGTVDAVVAGHTHQVVHHWVAGIPVIEGGAYGRYINIAYLTYDWAQKKVVTEETRIEGPVPVCAKVFQNQNDCNGDRPAPKNGRGPLVTAQFHGEPVVPDTEVKNLLRSAMEKNETLKAKVLGQAAKPIEMVRFRESELGNLVSDAIRQAAKADFSLVNSGGIRAPLEAGPITFGAVFQSIPFDNEISILRVTGSELRMIFRVAESGSRGFAPFSGLRLKVIDLSQEAPRNDLNGDGKDDVLEDKPNLRDDFT